MTTHPRTDARMTPSPLDRRLRAVVGVWPTESRPDAELLDRFARYGERPALEAVVRRHAPLVRGVCRRHLGHGPDADDAFQATFLVLLRHAGRGRAPHAVGPWLYAVAVRTAARLRGRRRHQPLPESVPDRSAAPDPAADWVPLLDRELAELPAKYRDALVLCELQGKPRREAATLLGIAEGTLSSRLSRGRELLRRRLLKHGTLFPAAGLGVLVAGEVASAELRTATLALADGAVPATVAAAVPPAGWGLWKLVAGAVLAAGVAGGLTVPPGDTPTPQADEPAKPAAIAAKLPAPAAGVKTPAGPAVPDLESLQGVWLFEDILLTDAGRQRFLGIKKATPALFAADVAAERKRVRLVVAGERWWEIDAYANPCALALRPDRLPKWLDLTYLPDREAPAGGIQRGVYALDGDRLTVASGGRRRPADLGPSDDEGRVSTTVYRKAPPPDPATAAALKPLLGRWQLVRGRHNLHADGTVTETALGWLEVTPYALFWRYNHSNADAARFNDPSAFGVTAATFSLDPSKKLPWIDLAVQTDIEDGEPAKRYGVYELAGDTLRLVFGRDRTFRPLDFGVEPYKSKRVPEEDGGAHVVPADGDPRVVAFELKRSRP